MTDTEAKNLINKIGFIAQSFLSMLEEAQETRGKRYGRNTL